jgi:hypothetical protein
MSRWLIFCWTIFSTQIHVGYDLSMLLVTTSDYPSNIDVIMLVDIPDFITGYWLLSSYSRPK